MMRGRNPYECFKNDRQRLFALISRDVRIVVVAIVGMAGASPAIRSMVASWIL